MRAAIASACRASTWHSQTFPAALATIDSGVPSMMNSPERMTRMRFAMNSTSLTMWVERITILSCAKLAMRLRKWTRSFGSSPAVGSSSTRIDGSLSMACAMPSLCLMPPLKVFTLRRATEERPTSSRRSLLRASPSRLLNPLRAAM